MALTKRKPESNSGSGLALKISPPENGLPVFKQTFQQAPLLAVHTPPIITTLSTTKPPTQKTLKAHAQTTSKPWQIGFSKRARIW